jgi:hypothetical protein
MNKITMSAKISLMGDNGLGRGFKTQQQYDFNLKEYRIVTEGDKHDFGKRCFHYNVVIDDVSYWVPGIYCVEYGEPIGKFNPVGQYDNVKNPEQYIVDKQELERRKFSNEDYAHDVEKLYSFMLRRTIKNVYKPDINKHLIEQVLK